MRMCNMDNFLEQARAREEAAKLIIDQSTRVALWMLCKDAKLRNRKWAAMVSGWLLDLNQREPSEKPSRQEILDCDAKECG
jgi:hypothetical protein